MLFTANQIAAFAGGVVDGDPEATVSTFAKIEEGVPGAISFLANPQYEKFLYETTASVVLVNKDFVPKQPVKATLVRVDDAYEAIAKLLTIYQSMGERVVGVSEKAFVHPTAHIGADCYVAPFAYIGANVKVGDNCDIHPGVVVQDNVEIGHDTVINPNVTIYKECKVGNQCIIHAGAVIGADGFGFAPTADGYEKIPQS